VLQVRLATSETYLDSTNTRQERTEWHNVVIWGKRAEGLHKILKKGDRILVEGSLRTSSWDDREGVKRYKTEIVARNVLLQGSKNGKPPAPAREAEPPSAGGGFPSDVDDDDIPF
jgi:single-strand DNA-binding protein